VVAGKLARPQRPIGVHLEEHRKKAPDVQDNGRTEVPAVGRHVVVIPLKLLQASEYRLGQVAVKGRGVVLKRQIV
jgi:hypothetical protein